MSGYLIPSGPSESTCEIKNSLFIASVMPIGSMDEMKRFVKELREKHPKANHNCWAVITGSPTDSNTFGFSDDGEPTGTAGKPIFTVLQYSGAGQIGVIVTRYFGGIKLGTGGLVKAYTASAKAGIEGADLISYSPMNSVHLTIPYNQEPHLRYLLEQCNVCGEFQYDHAVRVVVMVRQDRIDQLISLVKTTLGTSVGIAIQP